jgi:FKBP-type peptidyl-prolyl cis-trans isomerase 2
VIRLLRGAHRAAVSAGQASVRQRTLLLDHGAACRVLFYVKHSTGEKRFVLLFGCFRESLWPGERTRMVAFGSGARAVFSALAVRHGSQVCMTATSGVIVTTGALVNVDWSVSLARTGDRLAEHAPAQVTFDEGPICLIVGGGGYLPALHQVVTQLDAVGEERTFEVAPYDAFGERSADLGPIDFPATAAPEGLEVGMTVQLSNGLKALVTSMTDETVTIDANPALAGESLSITVKLLEEPVCLIKQNEPRVAGPSSRHPSAIRLSARLALCWCP